MWPSIATVGLLAVAVVGYASWWVNRAINRQSREFLARLDGPAVRRQP